MGKRDRRKRPVTLRCRNETHHVLGEVNYGRRTYWVLMELGPWVLKVYDPRVRDLRSIRLRDRSEAKNDSLARHLEVLRSAGAENSSFPRVFDFGRDDETEYMVLEWTSGRDLEFYIRTKLKKNKNAPGIFGTFQSYRFVRGLVFDLRQLHNRGIVHGDLKPRNIVVQRSRLVPIDFGISWVGERALRREKAGTRFYAAPEQFTEGLADGRADQFSLSVVFYQLLTKELPYDGLGGEAVHSKTPIKLVWPHKKNREVRKNLSAVVARGLALDPEGRFETTTAWVRALSAAKPPHPNEDFGRGLIDRVADGLFGWIDRLRWKGQ